MGKTKTIDELNICSREEFVREVGPVFEHSPWIAEVASARRPFADLEFMHQALCETVRAAGTEKQLELIQAHPDLVGRAALAGTLTSQSTSEQAAAGLDRLTEAEIDSFQQFNRSYRGKFGFPFVICARLNKKEAILNGFRTRLEHSREEEIETALGEIYKIAYLRLRDIVSP